MPKAKILLVPITPEVLRRYEGLIVCRESGLVRIKKVYTGQRMDYHSIDNPNEPLYGHLSAGFYAVVAWEVRGEEQHHYEIMQSNIRRALDFIPKHASGRFVTEVPQKYFTSLINIWINEHGEASLFSL